MKILGIIPARYASSRFPAKLLQEIEGKTVLQLVYDQCLKTKYLSEVVIATDHQLIFDSVKNFGGNVIMTADTHLSGTDRCAEALKIFGGASSYDFAVNIQGDEPLISPETIDDLCTHLDDKTEIATVYKKIDKLEDLLNPSIVKLVFGERNQALYFSRSPIPYIRDVEFDSWLNHCEFHKHLGIYAFDADVLTKIVKLSPSELELKEKLEQLRWLSNGFKISLVETTHESFGIDTKADFDKLKQFFNTH